MPMRRDPRAAVAAALGEARAYDHVRAVVQDRLQEPSDLARIVLPVAVDLDREVEVVLQRVLVSGLHRAPDAEIEREPEDDRARLLGRLGGAVGRAVVDDDDLEVRVRSSDLADHGRNRVLLVVRRNDHDPAHRRRDVLSGVRRTGDDQLLVRHRP